MPLSDDLLSYLGEIPTLSDDEHYAVYKWATDNKDYLPEPLKSGLLKLVNAEEHRRLKYKTHNKDSNSLDIER